MRSVHVAALLKKKSDKNLIFFLNPWLDYFIWEKKMKAKHKIMNQKVDYTPVMSSVCSRFQFYWFGWTAYRLTTCLLYPV